MYCPHCGEILPEVPGYMYICPFCHGVLAEMLKNKQYPPTDRFNKPIQQYHPDPRIIQKRGRLHSTMYINELESYVKEHKENRGQNIALIVLLAFSLIVMLFTGFFGGFLSFAIVGIIRLCDRVQENPTITIQQRLDALYGTAVGRTAIGFYGNEECFGLTTVPADCNLYDEMPEIVYHEIPKANITSVRMNELDEIEIEHFDHHKRSKKFSFEPFCDIEILHQILAQ